MIKPLIDIDELLEQVPDPFKDVARRHAMYFMSRGVTQTLDWIDRVLAMRDLADYRAALEVLTDDEALLEGQTLAQTWAELNAVNAADRERLEQAVAEGVNVAVMTALLYLGMGSLPGVAITFATPGAGEPAGELAGPS